MALLPRTRPKRPWYPWVRASVVVLVLFSAGWIVLELAQRYFGLQKLVIEQITVSGCRGDRQAEIQKLAEQRCMGKPLFWFDAEGLREKIEAKRWVHGLIIRKDPPDRLSLVVEERKPLLWLVRPSGTYLVSDDGVLMDQVNASNMMPIPVVADPRSQTDEGLLQLVRAARELRDKQPGFFERLSELRWSARGPIAFIEGFSAPIYLSRHNVTNNIPNFQAIYVDDLVKRTDFAQIPYVDLRWGSDNYVAVGSTGSSDQPIQKNR
jgi:POTRA domain, FtsQ-type/Cell division protein FtsQ